MTHPSKRKGDKYELEIAGLLADLTGWPVRRRLGAGRADDCGDLDGLPETCAQVKAYPSDFIRSIRECLADLPRQQANAGTPYAVGLIRRPGGRWFAVLDLDNLCALLREATGPEWDPPVVLRGPNGYYETNPLDLDNRCLATQLSSRLQCVRTTHPDPTHNYDPADPGTPTADPAWADWTGEAAPVTIIDKGPA